ATLVLVVVAIAGAAAVGTIMGSFSSDVSDDASSEEASAAASTELLIAGSTSVKPVSELAAEAYMENHKGVKVTVQGGGSGAGMTASSQGLVDIGAASKPVPAADYPELEVTQIGASAVCVIANGATGNITMNDLQQMYNGTFSDSGKDTNTSDSFDNDTTVIKRDESSGTQDTFSGYVFGDKHYIEDESDVTGKVGNQGVLNAVADTPNSIGFVDFGYVNDEVNVLGIIETGGTEYGDDKFDTNSDVGSDIEDTLSGDGEYPEGLTRPLNYMTLGAPSSLEQSFINYITSPAAEKHFHEVGYFSIYDYS
ncbi:substrate-binding domain-containing protein, partial [Methanohalophilus sp.]